MSARSSPASGGRSRAIQKRKDAASLREWGLGFYFPLPLIGIWAGFDGEHWTLYLPSKQ